MSNKIPKSLQGYFSKIKSSSSQFPLPSKKWILGCKHPRTPSFTLDDNPNVSQEHATLADIDQFLIENFKSLFVDKGEGTGEGNHNKNNNNNHASDDDDDDEEKDNKKPLKRLVTAPMFFDERETASNLTPRDSNSNQFFMTRGNFSGFSTTHDLETGSSSTSTTTTQSLNDQHHEASLPENCVAVLACSMSPYEDFRRSMQDMVEARMRMHERVDWDFMEELLFCYINMNEKKSFKFILNAFVDVITVMRRRTETPKPKPRSVRTVRIGREVRKKTKEVTLEFGSP